MNLKMITLLIFFTSLSYTQASKLHTAADKRMAKLNKKSAANKVQFEPLLYKRTKSKTLRLNPDFWFATTAIGALALILAAKGKIVDANIFIELNRIAPNKL